MPSVFYGVIAAVFWSTHDLFARSLAARVGPFRMAAWVMAIGTVLLTIVVAAKGWPTGLPRDQMLLAGLGGLAYGIGVGALFRAFSLGPISLVAPLTSTYPLLVFLWAVVTGVTPSLVQLLGTALVIGGAAVVARGGEEDGFAEIERANVLPFFFFCALSAFGLAAAVIAGQATATALGETETAWISRPLAFLALLPFCAREKPGGAMAPRHWLGLCIMAVLDVAALVVVNAAGLLPDKAFAAVGIAAYGAIAVLLSRQFLKEQVSLPQWLGIFLIVGGVALLAFPA
ncbi:DMT family transporter [Aestuariivirga sp.]|uniref:DMT family transporter n=1 Tax=Aestuariivirga sp. TaxID=2650926 RepID=UPI0039E2B219